MTSSGGVSASHWSTQSQYCGKAGIEGNAYVAQRDILKLVRPEDLEELQGGVARVLDVVAHGSGDVSNVTWLVVKSPGVGLGGKDGNASSSLPVLSSDRAIKMNGEDSQEETPLILGRVPVKLADCSGLNSHLCGADGLAGREGPCVDDLDRATVELGRGSLGQGEDE